ncbi:unnamed protein product, partial [Owenia fusiformis]
PVPAACQRQHNAKNPVRDDRRHPWVMKLLKISIIHVYDLRDTVYFLEDAYLDCCTVRYSLFNISLAFPTARCCKVFLVVGRMMGLLSMAIKAFVVRVTRATIIRPL